MVGDVGGALSPACGGGVMTKGEKRAAAAAKKRYGMRTQTRWWHAVAASQVKRGELPAPGKKAK